jgi:RsmE family RNA methyltransferase
VTWSRRKSRGPTTTTCGRAEPLNLLLFSADELDTHGEIRVEDQRLLHLRQVHRAQTGDTLRVGEIDGLVGQGEIVSIDQHSARIAVDLQEQPPAKLPLDLVIALPRPKMLRRILRAAAEFGVRELHLLHSYRVEKSYWQTPVLTPPTIRDYLLQGLEQSRDTALPSVSLHRRFKPFVEDQLPTLTDQRCALLAHPGDYPPCPRGPQGDSIVVIGPEGGFIPYEVEKLQEAGCQAVSLGPRILRVENAVTSLLGRLS